MQDKPTSVVDHLTSRVATRDMTDEHSAGSWPSSGVQSAGVRSANPACSCRLYYQRCVTNCALPAQGLLQAWRMRPGHREEQQPGGTLRQKKPSQNDRVGEHGDVLVKMPTNVCGQPLPACHAAQLQY